MAHIDVKRIAIEIMKGIGFGDVRSFIPVTEENENSWRTLEKEIAEISAKGGVVDLPGYENEYTEKDPETGRWIEVPPPDSPAGMAAARREAEDLSRGPLTDGGIEWPSRDRPSWMSADVGRYGYPMVWPDEVGETAAVGDLGKPPPVSRRFGDAVLFARSMHAGQARKGTQIPYISHLLAVTALAIEDAATDDALRDQTEAIAIAAMLHDVVEDTRATVVDVAGRFGDEVARIVAACSDTTESMPGEEKPPWSCRKQAYIDHLAEADQATLCVSLADKRHNARCIVEDAAAALLTGGDFWSRFNAGPDQQAWYYDELARVFSVRRPGPAADELCGTVARLRELAILTRHQ